ncbi:YidB family protein [Methylosinus sp. Sm6]|uniref:YidB family protein n=1 Tax=Methylosinus sp. Sm6 TaxID=2866948 RepID=UPI001C992ED5|nr:YidB family protein [Methylosinus sp. Sm6]MBY6242300.1 YidB family protein [Methylosinus sp. Sm6]
MGLLDGIIGGAIGVEIATLINGYVEKRGGLQNVIADFEKSGYGEKVKSWIGTGPNLPLTAEQVQQALGSERVKELGAKFGVPMDKVAAQLAEYLPKAIDKATPEGKLPADKS